MVLSGQNLEHLWPDEVVEFFLESARVLKSDGWLVFDSPNRLMTELLGWSHPEHTVELTPKEARALAELAGFDVVRLVGLWLCREPTTGRMMKFDPFGSEDQWSLIERVLAAESNPEDSFLYWLVARKARDPQPDALAAQMHSIFRTAWPSANDASSPVLARLLRKEDNVACEHHPTRVALWPLALTCL